MTVTVPSSFDPAGDGDMMSTSSAGADSENVKVYLSKLIIYQNFLSKYYICNFIKAPYLLFIMVGCGQGKTIEQ